MNGIPLRVRLAEWLVIASIAIATLALSGCAAVIGAIPDGGRIPQNLAEDYARLGAGASVQSIEVVSSRLSTYGTERPTGRSTSADTQVWAVILRGAFPYGSCGVGFNFGTAKPAQTSTPCPQPALRERILVDARNGRIVERIVPA